MSRAEVDSYEYAPLGITEDEIQTAIKDAEAGPEYLTPLEWGKQWGVCGGAARERLRKGSRLGMVHKRRVFRPENGSYKYTWGYKVTGQIPVYESGPKNIDWDNEPLGEITDYELAKQLGVSRPAVRGARHRRNIPVFDPKNEPKNIDWDSVPLGEYIDKTIAHILNVNRRTVARARTRRGIPSYRSQQ